MTTPEQKTTWAEHHKEAPHWGSLRAGQPSGWCMCEERWPCPVAQLLADLAAAQKALRAWVESLTWELPPLWCVCDRYNETGGHVPDCPTKAALEAVR